MKLIRRLIFIIVLIKFINCVNKTKLDDYYDSDDVDDDDGGGGGGSSNNIKKKINKYNYDHVDIAAHDEADEEDTSYNDDEDDYDDDDENRNSLRKSEEEPYNCPKQCNCKFNKTVDQQSPKTKAVHDYDYDSYEIYVDCSNASLKSLNNLFDDEFPLESIIKL